MGDAELGVDLITSENVVFSLNANGRISNDTDTYGGAHGTYTQHETGCDVNDCLCELHDFGCAALGHY